MFKQFDNLIDKLLLFLLFWYIPSSRIMYTPCICIISYIKKCSIFCQKIKLYLKRKSYSFISLNRSTNVTICVQREKYYFLFFSINGQNNVNMDNIITTHPAKTRLSCNFVWSQLMAILYDRKCNRVMERRDTMVRNAASWNRFLTTGRLLKSTNFIFPSVWNSQTTNGYSFNYTSR